MEKINYEFIEQYGRIRLADCETEITLGGMEYGCPLIGFEGEGDDERTILIGYAERWPDVDGPVRVVRMDGTEGYIDGWGREAGITWQHPRTRKIIAIDRDMRNRLLYGVQEHPDMPGGGVVRMMDVTESIKWYSVKMFPPHMWEEHKGKHWLTISKTEEEALIRMIVGIMSRIAY